MICSTKKPKLHSAKPNGRVEIRANVLSSVKITSPSSSSTSLFFSTIIPIPTDIKNRVRITNPKITIKVFIKFLLPVQLRTYFIFKIIVLFLQQIQKHYSTETDTGEFFSEIVTEGRNKIKKMFF